MLLCSGALVRAIPLSLLIIACIRPAAAADAGPGWDDATSYGTPFSAYRAGIGHREFDRRPLDNSLRSRPMPPERQPDWSGFYFGATAGAILGSSDFDRIAGSDADTDGFAAGGHVGYNFQNGPAFAGLEIDTTFSNAGGNKQTSGLVATTTSVDGLSSARVRAGYTYDNFLLYGTAGLALASTDIKITGPGFRSGISDLRTGYVIGAGAEMVLTDGVYARLEALHYGFSDDNVPVPSGTSDFDLSVTAIRAGLSFKFK